MDWVRSCYSSEWQLFSDSQVRTPGRYYFCAPTTPFVSGFHNFGSRVWLESNWQKVQGLGEALDSPHKWNRGDPPAVVPNARIVGNPDCLLNGDLIADALQGDQIKNGYPIACYTPQVPLDPTWETVSQWDICSLQFFYATIIKWISYGEFGLIPRAFQLLLGYNPQITLREGSGLFPTLITVIAGNVAIAVMNGTSNFQQLATQAFLAIVGPTEFGGFSTSALYYNCSEYVNQALIADGANPNQPVFLCGHSYGGAAMSVLAARYRNAKGGRPVRLLTFGAPKPGDFRLQEIVASCPGLALINDDDLVTALPPSRLDIYPVSVFLGLASLYVWDEWYRLPNQALMNTNGQLRFNESPILDFATMLSFTNTALTHGQLNPIAAHYIDDYRARIYRRCGGTEWPVNLPLWIWLQSQWAAITLHGGTLPAGSLTLRNPALSLGNLRLVSLTISFHGSILLGSATAVFPASLVLTAIPVQAGPLVFTATPAQAGSVLFVSPAGITPWVGSGGGKAEGQAVITGKHSWVGSGGGKAEGQANVTFIPGTPGGTLVQYAFGRSGASTAGATWPAATTAGNFLFALVSTQNGSAPTPPSGWGSVALSNPATGHRLDLWYIANASSRSGTETFSGFGASLENDVFLGEWNGLPSSASLDKTATSTNSFTATVASGTTGVTTHATELCLFGFNFSTSTGFITFYSPTNGFSLNSQGGGGNGHAAGFATYPQTATGARSSAVTASTATGICAGLMATFG